MKSPGRIQQRFAQGIQPAQKRKWSVPVQACETALRRTGGERERGYRAAFQKVRQKNSGSGRFKQ